MADNSDRSAPARRRRADAQRSIDAILSAARSELGRRSDASMEEIAAAAGVTRQTVYAHFSSRDALIATLVEDARTAGLAELTAAGLDAAPPAAALSTFLEISWRILDRCPMLFDPVLNRTPRLDGTDPHAEVTVHLEALIRRGQQAGDFSATLPADWLALAIFELGHAAAEQVVSGRFTADEAAAILRESSLMLCGRPRPGSASTVWSGSIPSSSR